MLFESRKERLSLQEGQPLPHSAKQCTITFLLKCFYSLLWQSNACLLEQFESCIEIYKREFESEGGRECFENTSSCRNNFAANAIAWYEAY